MGKTAGTLRFDEVGAQVVIVLLLALAIDARFFRLRAGRDSLDVVAICFTMILLAVGEYYALKGLLAEQPARAEMTAGAIAAGFTAVAITALAGSDSFTDDPPRSEAAPSGEQHPARGTDARDRPAPADLPPDY